MDTRVIAKEYRLSHWAVIMQERISSSASIKVYFQTAGICENVYYLLQKRLVIVYIEDNKISQIDGACLQGKVALLKK